MRGVLVDVGVGYTVLDEGVAEEVGAWPAPCKVRLELGAAGWLRRACARLWWGLGRVRCYAGRLL
ncbi:MAG: hypothetical protein QXJ21_02125 [Thermofilum sp.]